MLQPGGEGRSRSSLPSRLVVPTKKLTFSLFFLGVYSDRMGLEVAVALLLPDYWADFIRSGPIEDVKPLGVGKP